MANLGGTNYGNVAGFGRNIKEALTIDVPSVGMTITPTVGGAFNSIGGSVGLKTPAVLRQSRDFN